MRGRGRAHTKVLGTLLCGIRSSILLPRSRPPIGVLVRKEIQQDEIYSGCSKRPEAMPLRGMQTPHRLRLTVPAVAERGRGP